MRYPSKLLRGIVKYSHYYLHHGAAIGTHKSGIQALQGSLLTEPRQSPRFCPWFAIEDKSFGVSFLVQLTLLG